MSGTNGSGKSTIVNNCLRGYMARDTSSRAISTVVHTRTTTASVLRLTLNQLFKRRKGNAYGYEKGKTLYFALTILPNNFSFGVDKSSSGS